MSRTRLSASEVDPLELGGCREREVRVPGLESALRPEIRAEEDERPEQHRRRGRDDRHHGSGLVDVEIVVGVSDGDAQTEIRQPHEVADEVMDDVVADTAPARPGRLSRPSSTACLGSGCIASHRPTFTQVAPLGNSFRPAKREAVACSQATASGMQSDGVQSKSVGRVRARCPRWLSRTHVSGRGRRHRGGVASGTAACTEVAQRGWCCSRAGGPAGGGAPPVSPIASKPREHSGSRAGQFWGISPGSFSTTQ
jgi:hypothetical protein